MKDGPLLVSILTAEEKSGAAKYPASMEKTMARLERDGLIERHFMGSGAHCARLTKKGRNAAIVYCGNNF
jgi:hypothetical protein